MTTTFFEEAVTQQNPMRVLSDFLTVEERKNQSGDYDNLRFVGYVLDLGYDVVTIITSDPFKAAVGGVPRNSLLIMVPSDLPLGMPPHLTLLRVLDVAPTPLSNDIQQTYFELQKKSMPELDVFTQAELQWGALKTTVLGMLYQSPDDPTGVEFSGDLNNIVSAHKYRIYSPDDKLLDLVVNSTVPKNHRFPLGNLRFTEARLPLPGKPMPRVEVQLSTFDFMATRTALFGKTRLGKSNIVKLIAQSVIDTMKTGSEYSCGQLIFDVDGEYSNDNEQDGTVSVASAYKSRTTVYALTRKQATESKPLRLDFYAHPDKSHGILGQLLNSDGRTSSIYVNSFRTAQIPSLDGLDELPYNEQIRSTRRVLMFWAVLHKAGYSADEGKLRNLLKNGFDPGFKKELRAKIHGSEVPAPSSGLAALREELEKLIVFQRSDPNSPALKSSSGSGNQLFDADDQAILNFLNPAAGAGTSMIQPYTNYHDPKAGDFVEEIKQVLDKGETVILDLSNANPELVKFFSIELTRAIFYAQVQKFTLNKLGHHYVQLFFEEAHALFPTREQDTEEIYLRLAKEGAKYHIGMVYSTQSPSTLSRDLLAQTENFFVVHLSSEDDVNALARVNVAYKGLGDDLMRTRTVGYVRMLTRSNRFVVPLQARKFVLPNSPTP